MECIFCKIIAREIPATIVAEDDHTLAFLDIHPQAPGHTVVIPKTHAVDFTALPAAEVGPLFIAAQNISRRLLVGLEAQGLNLGINQGEAGGQTVGHLHIHLFPRFSGDGGRSVHATVNNPPQEDIAAIAEKIMKAS